MRRLSKYLFFALVLFLPANLGKHFVFNWSYSAVFLIDYLIPTVYVQDILIVAILVLWGLDLYFTQSAVISSAFQRSGTFPMPAKKTPFPINFSLIMFVFTVGLSVISAVSIYPAVYFFIRLVLYISLFFYVQFNFDFEKEFPQIIKYFAGSTLFISILGLLQWFKQGSVFNNYYVLGEQPYSFSTKDITLDNFLGVSRVPSYSLFRHPNIFAGFLCIVLVWILDSGLNAGERRHKILYLSTFLLGSVALFFTLSQFTYFVFGFSLVVYCATKLRTPLSKIFLVFSLLLCFALLLLPLTEIRDNISLFRRENFLEASYKIIENNFWFGVGPNNNVTQLITYLGYDSEYRFVQPVHNIFILIFTESGFFAFGFFLAFLACLFLATLRKFDRYNRLFYISLSQIALLGSFDHYFLSIHQTLLLFLLTCAFCVTYNFRR